MKCEKCGKNEATVYYKETVNGVTREIRLCPSCAKEENIGASFENAFQSMDQFWSDPFHSLSGGVFGNLWNELSGTPVALPGRQRTCPTCGMTESQLRQTGRVGCPDCYQTFADILNPYVRRVHGATQHIGTAPETAQQSKQNPVAALRTQLKDAIEREEYEQAARLRDEIRRMEGEQK